jgi:hypothetical protein
MNLYSQHIQTVLSILQDEVDGNVTAAFSKMTSSYSQTWMYKDSKGILFPRSERPTEEDMQSVYDYPNRKYHIYNITESTETVMLECVEMYREKDSDKYYVTPLVLIVEFEGDKILRGRHYCDPALSYLELDVKTIVSALSHKETILVIR